MTSKEWYYTLIISLFGLDYKFGVDVHTGVKNPKDWRKELEEVGSYEFWREIKRKAKSVEPGLYEAMREDVSRTKWWMIAIGWFGKVKFEKSNDIFRELTLRARGRFIKSRRCMEKDQPNWVVYTGRKGFHLTEDGFTYRKTKEGSGFSLICTTKYERSAEKIMMDVEDSFVYPVTAFTANKSGKSVQEKHVYYVADRIWNLYVKGSPMSQMIPIRFKKPWHLLDGDGEYYLWKLNRAFVKAGIFPGYCYL